MGQMIKIIINMNSIRKATRKLNMVKGLPEAIPEHCLITNSETISICCWSIWLNLMLEEVPKFPLELGSCALFWWRRWGRGWRRRCNMTTGPWEDLWIQPHMSKNLANSFLYFWAKGGVTCQTRTEYWSSCHKIHDHMLRKAACRAKV